jgi:translation initiation factor 5A
MEIEIRIKIDFHWTIEISHIKTPIGRLSSTNHYPISKMSDEEIHEKTDSGATLTYPAQAGSLKKGSLVCIKDFPCKVIETSTSKTGKHGHAKVHMFAVDIFTGKKYEDICPSSHNMMCPNVKKDEYELIDISKDGILTLMTDKGEEKTDVSIPEGEIGEQLVAAFKKSQEDGEILRPLVLSAMGKEQVVSWKNEKN